MFCTGEIFILIPVSSANVVMKLRFVLAYVRYENKK